MLFGSTIRVIICGRVIFRVIRATIHVIQFYDFCDNLWACYIRLHTKCCGVPYFDEYQQTLSLIVCVWCAIVYRLDGKSMLVVNDLLLAFS